MRDTSFLELKSLLSFIYHGEVNVSQERLGLLLKTAEALRIKGLAQDKRTSDSEHVSISVLSDESRTLFYFYIYIHIEKTEVRDRDMCIYIL